MTIVKFHPSTREFVVEAPPADASVSDLSMEMLRQRVRQQQILADFGVRALKGTPFPELLDEASQAAAQGLEAPFAKVLQYMPDQNRFVVAAGVGWEPGVVGSATVGADTASPAGYAMKTGKAVISNHLDIEERFRTPELLVQHGIRRAVNVILAGDATAFGVLEVDSRSEGEFSESDIVFLRGVANILGMAIERQRMEQNLQKAVEQQQVLMREVNHRVNNSLQMVASVLHLQSTVAASEDVRKELLQAETRITAIARAHRRLYSGDKITALDLAAYLREVCDDIASSVPNCEINVEVQQGIVIRTDRAIPAVLSVNELITNAVKYAYPGRACRVWVTLTRSSENTAVISVRDEGVGLPAQFDLKAGGLGMRLVNSFARQLLGELQVLSRKPGTEFVLSFPLNV